MKNIVIVISPSAFLLKLQRTPLQAFNLSVLEKPNPVINSSINITVACWVWLSQSRRLQRNNGVIVLTLLSSEISKYGLTSQFWDNQIQFSPVVL